MFLNSVLYEEEWSQRGSQRGSGYVAGPSDINSNNRSVSTSQWLGLGLGLGFEFGSKPSQAVESLPDGQDGYDDGHAGHYVAGQYMDGHDMTSREENTWETKAFIDVALTPAEDENRSHQMAEYLDLYVGCERTDIIAPEEGKQLEVHKG